MLNCALCGSNISNDLITWNVVCTRLTGLKSFIDSVIVQPELNTILHDQIDNILRNKDFRDIYIENYNKQSHGKAKQSKVLV